MGKQGNLRPTEQRTRRNMIKMGMKMGAILGRRARREAGNRPLSTVRTVNLVFGYIAVPDPELAADIEPFLPHCPVRRS
jgi:hypothetical protein